MRQNVSCGGSFHNEYATNKQRSSPTGNCQSGDFTWEAEFLGVTSQVSAYQAPRTVLSLRFVAGQHRGQPVLPCQATLALGFGVPFLRLAEAGAFKALR